MINKSAKSLALVLSAIKNLSELKGSTSKEILKYLSSMYDVPPKTARREMQTALKRGVMYGIVKKNGMHYALPSSMDSCQECAVDDLGPMEPCRPRRHRRSSRRSRRSRRGRSRRKKGCKCKPQRRKQGCDNKSCKKRSKQRRRRSRGKKCVCGRRRRRDEKKDGEKPKSADAPNPEKKKMAEVTRNPGTSENFEPDGNSSDSTISLSEN